MYQLHFFFFFFLEKMICSESLEGVPLLVLANKQDVPVLYPILVFTERIHALKRPRQRLMQTPAA